MKLYVIRHCEAAGQSANASLTQTGLQQAEKLADFLSAVDIGRIICSLYLRAQQSVHPFHKRHNIPITVDERLSERVLSNVAMEDWLERLKETFNDFDMTYEGGESSQEAMARAVAVVKELLVSDIHNVAIVTHGNLMTLLLRHFDERFGFHEWRNLTNPDVYLIKVGKDRHSVERVWDE